MKSSVKDFVWGFMPQFGNNMWGDIITPPERDGIQARILTDEELQKLAEEEQEA